MMASKKGDVDAVKELISRSADVNVDIYDGAGYTALEVAKESGLGEIEKLLKDAEDRSNF